MLELPGIVAAFLAIAMLFVIYAVVSVRQRDQKKKERRIRKTARIRRRRMSNPNPEKIVSHNDYINYIRARDWKWAVFCLLFFCLLCVII